MVFLKQKLVEIGDGQCAGVSHCDFWRHLGMSMSPIHVVLLLWCDCLPSSCEIIFFVVSVAASMM